MTGTTASSGRILYPRHERKAGRVGVQGIAESPDATDSSSGVAIMPIIWHKHCPYCKSRANMMIMVVKRNRTGRLGNGERRAL